MRTYGMRVYSLRTKVALEFYTSTVYPLHLNNFGLSGVNAHGVWTRKDDVVRRYIQSPEAANDARGFDIADIPSVDSTILAPSTSSPLRCPRSWESAHTSQQS
jgi:hypothetical protein